MSSYRRSRTTGGTFFFTITAWRRRPILTEQDVRKALHEAIICVQSRLPFSIHAWVLLPDHMHCILELPPGDAAFGKRLGMIKRYVSRSCTHLAMNDNLRTFSQYGRREILFWQRRFWEHEIRDAADFHRHMDYIHWNPVKHGYVERPVDWRFSTFHRCVREGVYDTGWGGGRALDMNADEFGE